MSKVFRIEVKSESISAIKHVYDWLEKNYGESYCQCVHYAPANKGHISINPKFWNTKEN